MYPTLDLKEVEAKAPPETFCTNQTSLLNASAFYSFDVAEIQDALPGGQPANVLPPLDGRYLFSDTATPGWSLRIPITGPTPSHIVRAESQSSISHTQGCQRQNIVSVCPKDLELPALHEYGSILPDTGATRQESRCNSLGSIDAHWQELTGYQNSYSAQLCEPYTSNGPTTHEHKPRAQRNEALKLWLRCNPAVPYPTLEKMREFATAEKKTLRQVQVAFSNLRARMRQPRNEVDTPAMSPNTVQFMTSEAHVEEQEQYTLDFDWSWLDLESYGLELSSPLPISASTPDLSMTEQDAYHNVSTPSFAPYSHYSSPSSQGCDTSSPRDLTTKSRKGKKRFAARKAPTLEQHTQPVATEQPLRRPTKRFYCTACSNAGPFKTYFDWKRHEEGKHWYIEAKYICMPNSEWTCAGKCVFCSHAIDDDTHHLLHNISGCLKKCEADRTFARKDLFKQHVKNMHLATADKREQDAFQIPDTWVEDVQSFDVDPAALWCGFCRQSFGRVADRMKHVAQHFQAGSDINTWVPSNSE